MCPLKNMILLGTYYRYGMYMVLTFISAILIFGRANKFLMRVTFGGYPFKSNLLLACKRESYNDTVETLICPQNLISPFRKQYFILPLLGKTYSKIFRKWKSKVNTSARMQKRLIRNIFSMKNKNNISWLKPTCSVLNS